MFVNRILVPAPGLILVATDKGLFRSIDGGRNFGANAPAFDNRAALLNGFIACLFADVRDAADSFYAGVVGIGVFRSTDGGATWTPIAGLPVQFLGNLEVVQSESNPQRLLASVQYTPSQQGAIPRYMGLHQSVDGGNSWKSTDGGATFGSPAATANLVHWDNHALAFSPRAHRSTGPTTVYIGTDGGIAKSADGGVTWANINGAIASNLFLGIGIGRGAGNLYTYGGCQDTGTSAHRASDAGTTIWHLGIDGDGYAVAVDPADPKIVYGFDDSLFIKSAVSGIMPVVSARWPPAESPDTTSRLKSM